MTQPPRICLHDVAAETARRLSLRSFDEDRAHELVQHALVNTFTRCPEFQVRSRKSGIRYFSKAANHLNVSQIRHGEVVKRHANELIRRKSRRLFDESRYVELMLLVQEWLAAESFGQYERQLRRWFLDSEGETHFGRLADITNRIASKKYQSLARSFAEYLDLPVDLVLSYSRRRRVRASA